MTILSGGRLVLRDRVLDPGSLVLDGDRIAGIEAGLLTGPAGADVRPMSGLTLVPGFIDVHVHGIEGVDTLDGPGAVARLAARLPRYGVTAFCPTAVACPPEALSQFLADVAAARAEAPSGAARVLPAHLESNFISPEWRGAQPGECLRLPGGSGPAAGGPFGAAEILRIFADRSAAIGIVTLAPELPGGLDLVRRLTARGHVVAMGHTGAGYAEAVAAIDAGITHATHLFNRMRRFDHRDPGAAGAVLESPSVAAEIICDGVHVHAAAVRMAARLKSADLLMAVSDGSACAGLPRGARARLGGRPIVAGARAAELEDGTLAGSLIAMDRAFVFLVRDVGLSMVEAARLCATTPARRLNLPEQGRIEVGCRADLAVLDQHLRVTQTWIGGRLAAEPG